MDFEEELRNTLRAGADGVETDLTALTTGGVAHGKRLVRRRRVTKALAAGVGVAVVGGLAYAGPWGTTTGTGFDAASTPSVSQPAAVETDITPQAALKILLDLLPKQARTGDFTGGDSTSEPVVRSPAAWVRLSYTDRVGTSDLYLYVGRFSAYDCLSEEDQTCHRSTLADGSILTIVRKGGPDKTLMWWATVNRQDGLSVTLLEERSQEWKEAGTRATPPLPIERLRAIVTSPRWQLRVDKAFAQQAESLFIPLPAGSPQTSPPSTVSPSSPGFSHSPSSSGSPSSPSSPG